MHLDTYLRPVFGSLTDRLLKRPQDGGDVQGGSVVFVEPEGEVNTNPPAVPLRYCWCIDAGHGHHTKGKRSPKRSELSGDRLIEYEFNRDIAERIIEQLSAYGREYIRTMPVHGKYGNALTERVRSANNHKTERPKLFVSIHGNAGPATTIDDYTHHSVTGIETWHAHQSNDGRKMAAVFQRHLIAETGMTNRHLRSKPTGQFYVLRATRMPAVLTENGFYNSRHDLPMMLTESFRQQIADAHVAAVMEIEKNGL